MYRVQVMLRDSQAGNPRWIEQCVAETTAAALVMASRLCQAYRYRLVGPAGEVYRLDWLDDPVDTDICNPIWILEEAMPCPA